MDRRNMLKKFLGPRATSVNEVGASPVVGESCLVSMDDQVAANIISRETTGLADPQLLAAPAENWLQCDDEFIFLSSKTTGLLRLQNVSINLMEAVEADMILRFMAPDGTRAAANGYVGICFGASINESFIDEKLIAGVTSCGHLFIGAGKSQRTIAAGILQSGIRINTSIIPQQGSACTMRIKALDSAGNTLDMLKMSVGQPISGSVCAVVQTAQSDAIPFVAFRNIIVRQKPFAASAYNSRPLHPETEHSIANERFHNPYKNTEQI